MALRRLFFGPGREGAGAELSRGRAGGPQGPSGEGRGPENCRPFGPVHRHPHDRLHLVCPSSVNGHFTFGLNDQEVVPLLQSGPLRQNWPVIMAAFPSCLRLSPPRTPARVQADLTASAFAALGWAWLPRAGHPSAQPPHGFRAAAAPRLPGQPREGQPCEGVGPALPSRGGQGPGSLGDGSHSPGSKEEKQPI